MNWGWAAALFPGIDKQKDRPVPLEVVGSDPGKKGLVATSSQDSGSRYLSMLLSLGPSKSLLPPGVWSDLSPVAGKQ